MAQQTGVQIVNGFKFWTEVQGEYVVKMAEGYLTDPNKDPRNRREHENISYGTGDDAGHLIARRFGGPDLECNFTRQNFIQNQGSGTYSQIERMWATEMKSDQKVWVQVRAMTRQGAERTFYRAVTWRTYGKHGSFTEGKPIYYLNTESWKSREKQGNDSSPEYENNVIQGNFGNRNG